MAHLLQEAQPVLVISISYFLFLLTINPLFKGVFLYARACLKTVVNANFCHLHVYSMHLAGFDDLVKSA